MKQTPHLSKMANRVLTTLIVFSCVSSAAAPAWADREDRYREDQHRDDQYRDDRQRDDWHSHAREAHEWHHRHWHNQDGQTIYDGGDPYVTYAPPVVVEPPPVYDDPQPGVNIVIPWNIR